MRRFAWLSIPLLLATAGFADAKTFTVDSTADSPDAKVGDGNCVSKAGGCTLRAAVEEANASGFATTINVPPGTYTLTSPDEGANFGERGPLLLGGETTVSGGGESKTIIDGGGKRRLFEVGNHGNVTLEDLTLRGAQVKGGDGAALLNRGNVQLSNVIFERNRAIGDPVVPKSGRGAALFNTNGGKAELDSVVAIGNLAEGKGGAIYNDEASSVKLMNSVVTGNQSLADAGGGISNHGNLDILISIVRGNQAVQGGGGIDNVESKASLIDVEISENKGGGVRSSGTLKAVNCTISANVGGGLLARAPGSVTLNNVTVGNNKGGGVKAAAGAKLTISNTVLAQNDGSDCAGELHSAGFNLIQAQGGCSVAGETEGDLYGKPAKLAALATNGGSSRTQALEDGSAALDAGNPAKADGNGNHCAPADQRGVARPQAGSGGVARCDIGAFEKK